MRVMIDEVLAPEEQMASTTATNLAHLPPPSDIHGIEVFAGPASIPGKYSGLGSGKWCGLIMLWTK
jgi:hypothetical protein